MRKRTHLMLLIMFVSTLGCTTDQNLSPITDGEQITVTIKVPEELIAEVMQVRYRSKVCTFTDYTASGEPYQRYGYQRTDIQPVRVGQTALYEAKLPVDGGGACQWRLSNVTFGVMYEDTTQFGAEVKYGAGGGVIVMFDNNNASRSGPYRKIDGDLVVRQDYYPWLHEGFIGGHRKRIYLAGESDIYISYQALNARSVYFEPTLHSGFVARSMGPKVVGDNHKTVFHYPDGSSSPERQFQPSFRKLQSIRLAAEAKE